MVAENDLKHLYCAQRLSMAGVAKRLRTTHATVLYWMKRYGIPRRSWSESTYTKLNPEGDPFRIVNTLTQAQQELLNAGLLLYWAEGSKRKGVVHLGNLDVRMHQLFLRFLREICAVDEQRLRLSVRVHRQFSLRTARRYWSKELRLPLSQVLVYRHTDTRSRRDRQWSQYGIATLQFQNTKFKEWLTKTTEKYLSRWLGVNDDGTWQVAESHATSCAA